MVIHYGKWSNDGVNIIFFKKLHWEWVLKTVNVIVKNK